VAAVLLFIVVVLPILLFFVGPTLVGAYDAHHKTSLRCTVKSATVGSTSARSLKGAGSSSTYVDILTKECGTLLLEKGVNAQNGKKVAAGIRNGDEYIFQVGQGTYGLRTAFEIFKVFPDVQEYRRAPGS